MFTCPRDRADQLLVRGDDNLYLAEMCEHNEVLIAVVNQAHALPDLGVGSLWNVNSRGHLLVHTVTL